jgi:hypothetical protein
MGAAPSPVNVTVWGLFQALSVMFRLPVRVPFAVGVKVTLIVQLEPVPTLLPQVFVREKSPLATMLDMDSGAFPVLVSVTACGSLVDPTNRRENVREDGDKPTAGPVPVPVTPTACGLFKALSVIASVAVRVPPAVGVKVTLIVQVPPAATELPQVLLWA